MNDKIKYTDCLYQYQATATKMAVEQQGDRVLHVMQDEVRHGIAAHIAHKKVAIELVKKFGQEHYSAHMRLLVVTEDEFDALVMQRIESMKRNGFIHYHELIP